MDHVKLPWKHGEVGMLGTGQPSVPLPVLGRVVPRKRPLYSCNAYLAVRAPPPQRERGLADAWPVLKRGKAPVCQAGYPGASRRRVKFISFNEGTGEAWAAW